MISVFRNELCVYLQLIKQSIKLFPFDIFLFFSSLSFLCFDRFSLNFLNIKEEMGRLQPSSLSHLFWICHCSLSISVSRPTKSSTIFPLMPRKSIHSLISSMFYLSKKRRKQIGTGITNRKMSATSSNSYISQDLCQKNRGGGGVGFKSHTPIPLFKSDPVTPIHVRRRCFSSRLFYPSSRVVLVLF